MHRLLVRHPHPAATPRCLPSGAKFVHVEVPA